MKYEAYTFEGVERNREELLSNEKIVRLVCTICRRHEHGMTRAILLTERD
jgi:hypothetical protein